MSLISFNSQQTYNNFSADKSGYFEISDTPKIGSIAIFQKTATSGHAGIVEKIYSDSFDSIEGNYSDKVSRVKRKLSKTYIYSNGLKLRGFINIK
jgi:surface antigen